MIAPSLLNRYLQTGPAPIAHPVLDGLSRRWRNAAPVTDHKAITIRRAREADVPALERLQQLDGRTLPAGTQVIAEADGRLVAAAELRSGKAVADPFAQSAEVLDLLRLRAGQLAA